ncbi:Nephrin [Orchesella cincta]|uniref:Nephrin n=1 Tax=Orchesella cincta TaxID=48709 RepID=A0A1D2MLM3_ORCCI|nr:Nephrin [Orchesella cincta]
MRFQLFSILFTLARAVNPKDVKISGPTEAKPGDNITLTCSTSNSNPKAEIAWFKGGESVEALYTYSPPSPDGGWTTISNVSIPIYESDRSIIITCQGVNKGLGESKVASHTINVIQPPGRPRIYKTSLNMTAGHSQQVTCTSTGGHPPATLQWYKGNKKVDSRMETKGNMVTAELSLVATPTDNGEVYRCEAKNKAISKAYTESITFHVLFAPPNVNITVNPQTLKEGQRVNLTCESGSSNPSAKMTWFKDGVSIPSSSNYTLPGDNRGKRAVSVLMLDLTSELDNALYTCSAQNGAVKKSVHDTITLQVAYKPKFIENPGEKVTVVEGKSTSITVKAKGNPDQITYKWSKNGSPVLTTKGKVSVDGAELSFIDVSRKDKGKYEIEASNKEGTSTLNVELDVQYPANVDTPFSWIMIGEGELANLECHIDANPLEESMVQWSHESADKMSQLGERAERAFQDNKSYLTIKNVTAADAGLYFCTVDNEIGEATNRSIFLIVKHKPDIDLSPQIAKAASNKGETGKLICRAKGAPNVTFSWSREGRTITNETEPAKYSVVYNQVDMMTWESILLVKDVQTRDYGGYECVARNELDDERHTVRLDITSAPEPPIGLHVVNFTHDSVTLTWIPGFDGGYEQSYKIRYIRVGSDNARYVEVFPKNMTIFTVTQLALGTEYAFAVAAHNVIGESNYTTETVRQETSSKDPVSQVFAEYLKIILHCYYYMISFFLSTFFLSELNAE